MEENRMPAEKQGLWAKCKAGFAYCKEKIVNSKSKIWHFALLLLAFFAIEFLAFIMLLPSVGFCLLFGLFWSLACILSAFFAEELFRHNLRFSIKNAENAEPSEWELMSRWISWLVFTVLALVLYIGGLSAPIFN